MYRQGERAICTLKIEQAEVGRDFRIQHTITQEDVDTFARLTGDFNPLHLDEDFARQAGFGKPVVYGMLSASFISTMIGMIIPGKGALWTSQTLEFHLPAYVGDTIEVIATIKQRSIAAKMLVLDVKIENQHRHLLVQGESKVKLIEIKESNMDLSEKRNTVIITGASGGIGSAIARALAQQGYKVGINYFGNEGHARLLATEIETAGGQAILLKGNVSNPQEMEGLFTQFRERFGSVEAVVHCAAPESVPHSFETADWQRFQKQIDVQIQGAFNLAKFALPQMIDQKYGSFVFMGSIFGDGVPPTQQSGYVVAKAALSAFARSLAVEYGPKGIRVNVVAPGMTQTQMISNIPEKAKMLTRMQTPMRRLAEPEDISGVVSFLLSPAAKHISGETIRVCGGIAM